PPGPDRASRPGVRDGGEAAAARVRLRPPRPARDHVVGLRAERALLAGAGAPGLPPRRAPAPSHPEGRRLPRLPRLRSAPPGVARRGQGLVMLPKRLRPGGL